MTFNIDVNQVNGLIDSVRRKKRMLFRQTFAYGWCIAGKWWKTVFFWQCCSSKSTLQLCRRKLLFVAFMHLLPVMNHPYATSVSKNWRFFDVYHWWYFEYATHALFTLSDGFSVLTPSKHSDFRVMASIYIGSVWLFDCPLLFATTLVVLKCVCA